MNVCLTYAWLQHEGRRDSTKLLELLRWIGRTGSLRKAAANLGVSYRHAWDIVHEWEAATQGRLLTATHGQGARLSDLGQLLLELDDEIDRELDAVRTRVAALASSRLANRSQPASTSLRFCASHDVLLAELKRRGTLPGGVRLELNFAGSAHALQALVHDSCDVAGFHIGFDANGQVLSALTLLRWLRRERFAFFRFADRAQGLMLPRRLKAKVKHLADVARLGLRLVNRQAGSGTRILLDALLERSGLTTDQLRSYDHEQPDHDAVAAAVAAGMADVGFGIAAAAAQAKLHFVPLARETYFIACDRDKADAAAVRALLDYLDSPAFRALAAQHPGYDTQGSGSGASIPGTRPAHEAQGRG